MQINANTFPDHRVEGLSFRQQRFTKIQFFLEAGKLILKFKWGPTSNLHLEVLMFTRIIKSM